MSDRPNLLFLSCDGLRADGIGVFGGAGARTPNIDGLAAEGVRFNRAYCTQPICMPCRSSIMTGRYPRAHGAWDNGVPLNPAEPTLPQFLSRAGYRTSCCGKFHFQPWLDSLNPDEGAHKPEYTGPAPYYGFEDICLIDHSDGDAYSAWVREHWPEHFETAVHPRSERPEGATLAWKSALPKEATKGAFVAERTIERIRGFAEDPGQPFFLWSSLIEPHHPYNPPAPFHSWFDDLEVPPPPQLQGPSESMPAHYRHWQEELRVHWGLEDTAQKQYALIRRMYLGKVALADYQIGRVLAALDKAGLRENTHVVFFSDHGCMLGEHGLLQVGPYSRESLIRIPLIWCPPGKGGANRGRVREDLVSAVDFLPSVLDCAGIDSPLGVQGQSLQPLLEADGGNGRDALLVENRWGQSPPDGYKILVTGRHKLCLYANGKEGELYDLEEDPREERNLFGLAGFETLERELMQRLAAELLRTEDPLPERTACW